jgi:hypothetical protein
MVRSPSALWQRNNNVLQSRFTRGRDRLTLPANWGQIDPAAADLAFLPGWRYFFGNVI